MPGMHVKFAILPEDFLGHLTEAAYHVALKHGLKAPFLEVEMDLYEALRKTMEEDMLVCETCGSKACLATKRKSVDVWSEDATHLYGKS